MTAMPRQAGLDRRKSIILGVIGLAFIVVIFWKVIPQIGSYSEAAAALRTMGSAAIVAVVAAVLLYLAIYGLPFMAATPASPPDSAALRYWPAQQVNQAAFAISNGVPGGGAVGLAVQFGMLTSYAVSPTVATAAITVVGLWSMFVTLGVPLLGILAAAVDGGNEGPYVTVGLIGLAVLVAAVVLLVLVIRSERLAEALGRLANRVVGPLAHRIKSLRTTDFVPIIVRFRTDIHDVVARRWAAITASQLGVTLSQFLILYMALRGVEGWDRAGTPILLAFAAFAISQLGLMIPITPGGLGTVDAAMIALLVAFGATQGDATAAALVWRASSFVPQIAIGVIALVSWYRRAGRMLAGRES